MSSSKNSLIFLNHTRTPRNGFIHTCKTNSYRTPVSSINLSQYCNTRFKNKGTRIRNKEALQTERYEDCPLGNLDEDKDVKVNTVKTVNCWL